MAEINYLIRNQEDLSKINLGEMIILDGNFGKLISKKSLDSPYEDALAVTIKRKGEEFLYLATPMRVVYAPGLWEDIQELEENPQQWMDIYSKELKEGIK